MTPRVTLVTASRYLVFAVLMAGLICLAGAASAGQVSASAPPGVAADAVELPEPAVGPAGSSTPQAVPVPPGWRAESKVARPAALRRLLAREAHATAALTRPVPPGESRGIVPALGGARPGAAATAIAFALAQRGKPYMWGAEGPNAYDCSGLTQRSYAAAGVALPRVAADQAWAGIPVGLDQLLPGDLVFWAYDEANPATIHHVALYLGGGLVVHAPQTGDVVRVARLWLDGYAGAVRVATPAGSGPLPVPILVPPPVGSPGPGAGGTPPADPAGSDPSTAPAAGPSSPAERSPAPGPEPEPAPGPSAPPVSSVPPSPSPPPVSSVPSSPSPTPESNPAEPSAPPASATQAAPTEPMPSASPVASSTAAPSPAEPTPTEPTPTATLGG
jgi:peptidoglycan DL-endopeptidase CwlO